MRAPPAARFVSNVTLTVTDPTQLQASEYELVQSAGAWQLTRRLDGFTQTVVDGSVVDGFQINLGTAAAGGERSLPAATGDACGQLADARARRSTRHRRRLAGHRHRGGHEQRHRGDRWALPW